MVNFIKRYDTDLCRHFQLKRLEQTRSFFVVCHPFVGLRLFGVRETRRNHLETPVLQYPPIT
jgi:hypothetical protein